jgi:hypothetical protein
VIKRYAASQEGEVNEDERSKRYKRPTSRIGHGVQPFRQWLKRERFQVRE